MCGTKVAGNASVDVATSKTSDLQAKQGLAHALQKYLSELVDIAIERPRYESQRREAYNKLTDLENHQKQAQTKSVEAVREAAMMIQRLPRAPFEELRSLSNPPRVVRESVALFYAILRPADLLESVEHSCWQSVVSILQHESILQQVAELPSASERVSLLLAVPAIRHAMEALDSRPCQTLITASESKTRMPLSARTPSRSFAAGAAARLLSLTPRHTGDTSMARGLHSSQVFVLSSTDVQDASSPIPASASLLELVRDRGISAYEELRCLSPAASVLLRWCLNQLWSLKAQLPQTATRDAAQQEGKAAELSLAALLSREQTLLEQVLSLRRRSAPWEPCDQSNAESHRRLVEDGVIKFSKGSALMSSLAARPLSKLVESMKQDTALCLVLWGCSSSEEEWSIGSQRAAVVSKYLQGQGLDVARLVCVPFSGASEVRLTPLRIDPLAKCNFSACGDALSPEAVEALQPLVPILKSTSFLRVSIEGHTCNDSMWMGNVALSEGRARRVARFFREFGVPSDQIDEIAHGDRIPLVPNSDVEQKQLNRRVEVRLRLKESMAAVDLQCRSESLTREQHKSNLLELALFAADVTSNSSTLVALHRVVCQALPSLGIPWGPKLLSIEAWE